jgi:transcriptional regulator with XRE-family HTH domain
MKVKFLIHYQTIGKNVRYLRNINGWTQEDLANKCSINREQVSRIENASRDYMYSTLLEVCEAFDKTIIEISQQNDEADKFHKKFIGKKRGS